MGLKDSSPSSGRSLSSRAKVCHLFDRAHLLAVVQYLAHLWGQPPSAVRSSEARLVSCPPQNSRASPARQPRAAVPTVARFHTDHVTSNLASHPKSADHS